MAVVKSCTIGLRRLYKHPFADFENFTIEGALTIELEPDESMADALKKSFPILRAQMIETYKEFKPRRSDGKPSDKA